LQVIKPDHVLESVKIKKVDQERSEAIMTQMGELEKGGDGKAKLNHHCGGGPPTGILQAVTRLSTSIR